MMMGSSQRTNQEHLLKYCKEHERLGLNLHREKEIDLKKYANQGTDLQSDHLFGIIDSEEISENPPPPPPQ